MGEQRRWQVGPRHQRLREKVRAPVGLPATRVACDVRASAALGLGRRGFGVMGRCKRC